MPVENGFSAWLSEWQVTAAVAALWAYIEVRMQILKGATATNSKDISKQGERIEKSIDKLAEGIKEMTQANMQVIQNQAALEERERATQDRVARLEQRIDGMTGS